MVAQAEITVKRGVRFDTSYVLAINELVTGSSAHKGWIGERFADGNCWVARKGDEIVGFAIFIPSFFREWFIDLVIVHPDHRRQGVGSALVRQCEASCKQAKLFTSTNVSNEAMRALLAKLDYQPSGQVENLDEGDPELIFVKKLGA